MELEQLVVHFESLGDNCEFGLFQRRCGAEPLGFFRWNWTTLDSLLSVLEDGFQHLGAKAEMEIYTNPANGEFMVKMPRYSFSYHTHQWEHATTADEVEAQQRKVQEFLKRKFLEDLASGEKIFVRKGNDTQFWTEAQRLLDAMRRYGPGPLLWVVPRDEAHAKGTVEVVEDGLLKGYIDRLAPYDTAVDLSPCWVDICRHAYGLLRARMLAGTEMRRPEAEPVATNLLRRQHIDVAQGWSGPWRSPAAISTALPTAGPHEAPRSKVFSHRLVDETTSAGPAIFGFTIPHGFAPGEVYVVSAYIYVPDGTDVAGISAVMAGYQSLRVGRADTTIRNRWQRIFTAARVPDDLMRAVPSLHVVGRAGAELYSAGWQVEIGWNPKSYAPSDSGGFLVG